MHNRVIVIGQYQIEVRAEASVDYSASNYWAQVVDSRGVLARFGKPIPAIVPALISRDAAIQAATDWIAKQI